MDWVHLSESGDEISLTVDPLGEEAARGALVMVFSEDFWTSIETDSIAKYGDLKTALFGQEVVASLDNGEQIMGDIVKFEYSDNVWTSFDQAKEGEASEDQLILGGYYYSYFDDGGEFNPENEMWMTFADVNGMGMEGVNVSITDITGTAEADAALNDMGISGIPVYKVSYPESLATTADNALVVEVQSGMEATDNIGSAWVDGVTAETLTHEGKPCVKIYGTNASAATACHLAVGNFDMMQFFKATGGETSAQLSRADVDKLGDAKKIEIEMQFEGTSITQTLVLNSYNEANAEYGLRSDKLQLVVGEYRIVGYRLLDGLDEVMTGIPAGADETFTVTSGGLTVKDLTVDAQARGTVTFKLVKDGLSRAAGEYLFSSIALVDVTVTNAFTQMSTTFNKLKVTYEEDYEESVSEDDPNDKYKNIATAKCDSAVWLEAGTYRVTAYTNQRL